MSSCAYTVIFPTPVLKIKTDNKIRIKDIAERAKVSVGTVDRVLHNRGEVAEETRKQVLNIVKDFGYTPNILAKSLASKKLFRIIALIPGLTAENPYWEMPYQGIKEAQAEIKDFNARVEIITFDLKSDASFQKAFDKVFQSKPDGIVFTPLFEESSRKYISLCEERNIPYVFVDGQLENCNNLAYFGQDAVQSGFLAAKLMHCSLPNKSRVLLVKLVNRERISNHLMLREKGFMSFFDGAANCKEISTNTLQINLTLDSNLDEILDSSVKKFPGLKGIFVTNSKVFRVAEWLKERNDLNCLLLGYDLIEKNLNFLEEGTINFLIGQKSEEQGYKSVIALFNYLISGKEINKINYSPIDIIMKENIDYYKNYKI